jgi:Family of unknown function (DUF5677)
MENHNVEVSNIDFKIIKEVFDRVILTIQNKIKLEALCIESELQMPLQLLFKMANVNFQGILYLCDSSERDKNLLYLNCPSINRSLFDNLFQTIFLLEDSKRFREQFYKTRLREAKEIHQFRSNEYGEDEQATNHISELEKIVDDEWNLTEEQKDNFRKIRKHISTNQIVNEFTDKKYSIAPLLRYLTELYYLNLSQLSHSQPTAIVSFYHHIIQGGNERLMEFINDERWTAINLFLCLVSEIEIHLNLGLKQDVLTMWLHFKEGSIYTNKIYEMRYKTLFEL